MKNEKKSILHLFLVLVTIVVLASIVFLGIGKHHKGSAKNIKLGLDLAGGVSVTYETVKEDPTEEELKDTIYKMQKRVEGYSTESAVYQEGSRRINIDIPGVTDANDILAKLGKAGSIEFVGEDGETVIGGADIKTAKAGAIRDSLNNNEYIVELDLTEEGAKKFEEGTRKNLKKRIAIIYDGAVISAPEVSNVIVGGKAQISGQATYEEAEELASTIRIGALPLELKEIRSNVVGAKLGDEAIRTSLLAGFLGFAIVLLFMISFYRVPGLAASIALTLYVGLVMVVLNGANVTLTLPGVAGIILSIGMAVDANVIIFTRIKEELAIGKTVRSAIKIGFSKALSAIVDGNVTTLIAAAVLWFKGSGTIKGFAQTLAIGIILSMFTSLIVTKFVLTALFNLGLNNEKLYGVQKEVKIRNFIGNGKKFAFISITLIAIGFVAMGVNKSSRGEILEYGLDFKGGTSTEVTFNETPPVNADITSLVSSIIQDANVEISAIADSNAVIIKTKELTLDQRTKVEEKLISEYKVDKGNIKTESISATVSGEMKADAIIAVIIATICMLLYIWFRFKDINFASSAVIALLHDVLIVLMVYAVCRISVGNTFIACMLTIVGYSINATIVIFDRIRENKLVMKQKDSLEDVVNSSISQTMSRSINTSLTTFIMIVVLYILGVDTIKEFALPLMAGIIFGAYSSICVTGTLWYIFKTKIGKSVKKA